MKPLIAPGVGIVIEVDTGINLTGNTGLSIFFTSPVGTEVEKTATISSTSNTVMEYTVQAGDFDPNVAAQLGDYILVAGASFASAPAIYSNPVGLKVVKRGQRV